MQTIGFIGAGNMSSAIIGGLLKSGFTPKNILIFDTDSEKQKHFENMGLVVAKSNKELVKKSNLVFLCVKPQIFEIILDDLENDDENKIFISVAAGITTDYIRKGAGKNAKVIRTMPNTPLLLGAGATALCRTENVTDKEFSCVLDIFLSLGTAEELDECQMNAVIAVNGSSPAYIYLFAKAVCEEAKSEGIDEKVALKLFCKTLEGSAKMLTESGKTPSELINMVTSPGGTTLAALKVFNDEGFENIIKNAMKACTNRAQELAKK